MGHLLPSCLCWKTCNFTAAVKKSCTTVYRKKKIKSDYVQVTNNFLIWISLESKKIVLRGTINMRPVHTLSASFVYFSVSSRARVFLCLHSQYAWFLMKPSAVEYWWRSGNESSVYENFSSTVSLFGAISGVYCECRLTCRCVWRCVTVLEYILVRCESVCGCINVSRAPPASLQAEPA